MSEKIKVLGIDANTISHVFNTGGKAGLDLLFRDGRQVVLTQNILEELGNVKGPTGIGFLEWYGENTNKFLTPPDVYLDPSNHVGERSLELFAEMYGDQYDIRFLSDDKGFLNKLRSQKTETLNSKGISERPYNGFGEFLTENLKNGNVEASEVVGYQSKFKDLVDKNIYSPKVFAFFPDDTKLAEYIDDPSPSKFDGIFTKSVLIGAGVELARELGIVGDILSFGITSAEASELIAQGEDAKAEQVWVGYFADAVGGTAGAVGGATVALGVLAIFIPEPTSTVSGVVAVLGALVGGFAVGTAAEDFAQYLTEELQKKKANGEAIVLDDFIELYDAFAKNYNIHVDQFEYGNDGLIHFANGDSGVFLVEGKVKALVSRDLYETKYIYVDSDGNPTGFKKTMFADGSTKFEGSESTSPGSYVNYLYETGTDISQITDDTTIIAQGIDTNNKSFRIYAGEVRNWLERTAEYDTPLDAEYIIDSFANGVSDVNGPEGVPWRAIINPDQGTDFDNDRYGFDNQTNFLHGNTKTETVSESGLTSTINQGFVISNSNWHVKSQTINAPGFWNEVNAAISDGYQPGRGNVFNDLISYDVNNVFGLNIEKIIVEPLEPPEWYNGSRFGSILSYDTSYSKSLAEIDPLVLDLDGDGVELTSFSSNYLFFDIDNDGYKERTGWVGADDGMLVHDLNGDGKINNITEALSEYYNAAAGTGAIWSSSFDALSSLDSNGDGVINHLDDVFSDLRVWQDTNSNGETDAGELKSLDELNITELSLNDTIDGSFIGGNEVKSNSTFKRTDGAIRTLAAVNFIADPNGVTESADGKGTRFSVEEGDSVYSVQSEAGETVDVAAQNVVSAIGGTGNDTLIGDAEDNWLIGSLGEDQLSGGAGNDYLVADQADISNTQDNIQGGSGFDIVQFVGTEGVAFNLQKSQIEMAIGTDLADVLISGSADHSIINGGAGNDIIQGGLADDVLNGEEGHDTIYGNQGDDLIRGHRGSDYLSGGAGGDILQGGLDDDVLNGGAGEDLLDGGAGNDQIEGGEGYDVAQYSGSYGDYSVTRNSDGSLTVKDLRNENPDGTDTLFDVEAFNFADIKEVQINGDNPMPVKDVVTGTAESDGQTYRIAIADLLSNDIDYKGDALSLREVFDATGGTVSIDGNEVVFVLDAGFSGIPSFSYKISDEHGNNGLNVGVTGSTDTAEMTARVTLVLEEHPDDPEFLDQWYLSEINALQAWQDYTGKGVSVGVFELGPWDGEEYGMIDYNHFDLASNIDPGWLQTVDTNIESTKHATLVAGVIAAARNGEGSIGVAYDATLAGEGLKMSDISAMRNWNNYDVVNNSWGVTELFGDLVSDAAGKGISQGFFHDAALHGRDGLGTIVVFGGGNDREKGHDTNAQDLTNGRVGITVGSVNAEDDLGNLLVTKDPFSNPGASILVSAPGSNIKSTSRLVENKNGSTFGGDYETAAGTSFAAPIVSGVVALMLEANPDLGWRDVQEILAYSAKAVNDPHTSWSFNKATNWNGGGLHYSHDYGFGLVDAHAAVRLAETWSSQKTSFNEYVVSSESGDVNLAVPDGVDDVSHSLSVSSNLSIENIEVIFDLEHEQIGDLEIVLTSPDGTESILVNRPGVNANDNNSGIGAFDRTWQTTTNNHWGENSAGTWTLTVKDKVTGNTGTLKNWTLKLYGEEASDDDVYIFTNEFQGDFLSLLTDSSGNDTINLAAVTKNSYIDLSGEYLSSVNGYNGVVSASGSEKGREVIISLLQLILNKIQTALANQTDRIELEKATLAEIKLNIESTQVLLEQTELKYNEMFEAFGRFDVQLGLWGNIQLIDIDEPTGSSRWLKELRPHEFDSLRQNYISSVNNLRDLQEKMKTYQEMIKFFPEREESIWHLEGHVSYLDNQALIVQHQIDLLTEGSPANQIESVIAGDGHDQLRGSLKDNYLFGGRGDDIIWGMEGDDEIHGGKGHDQLQGNEGNDFLDGGSGNDLLGGFDGDDRLYGGTGNDQLHGHDGNDLLVGGAGEDSIYGDQGIDTASYQGSEEGVSINLATGIHSGGDAEGDTLYDIENLEGSEYADVLVGDAEDNLLEGGLGADRIIGGAGLDTASYENAGESVSVNLVTGIHSGSDAEGDILSEIENLRGSAHDDVLVGDAEDNLFEGGLGADRIIGGTGLDTASYENAGESVSVNLATGIHSGSDAEGDILSEIENLRGSAHDDILVGDTGDNLIKGGLGADRLEGGAGSDNLYGGQGNDLLIGGDSDGDTYHYDLDGGLDRIRNSGLNGKVIFGEGIKSDQLKFYKDNDDLIVRLMRDNLDVEEVASTNDETVRKYNPDVISLSDGGYAVAWKQYDQNNGTTGIYVQQYDASGEKNGPENLITNLANYGNGNPTVAALDHGGFVVIWGEPSGNNDTSARSDDIININLQRYDATGEPLGIQALVTTHPFGFNNGEYTVTELSGGGFVVNWQVFSSNSSTLDIYQQQYDLNGDKVGSETLVNGDYGTENHQASASTALVDGGWIVAWQSELSLGSGDPFETGIYYERFNANGEKIGLESYGPNGVKIHKGTLVNGTMDGYQELPSVTGLPDGGYVIVWNSRERNYTDETTWDGYLDSKIYLQRYDVNGGTVGPETLVNSTPTGIQTFTQATVTALSDGGYVVAWVADQGTGHDVYMQVYNVNGQALGEETLITSGGHSPVVEGFDDGSFVVSWSSANKIFKKQFFTDDDLVIENWYQNEENKVSFELSDGEKVLVEKVAIADNDEIYEFSMGDGSNRIVTTKQNTKIVFGEGLTADDIKFAISDYDLIVKISSTDELILEGWLWENNPQAIFELFDGTPLNFIHGDHYDGELSGSSAIDIIYGSGKDDVINGGEGSDILSGGEGDDSIEGGTSNGDVYLYDRGDGQDQILNNGLNGKVIFGEGITHDDVTFSMLGADLVVEVAGASNSSEFIVNSTPSGGAENASITPLSDGGFVVVWESSGQDDPSDEWGGGVYFQRYDANRSAIGTETLVNSTVGGSQSSAAIASLPDGGFIITWQSSGQDNSDKTWETGIYLQRYDAAGNTVGPETLVNTTVENNQRQPSITVLSDGGYVVAWDSTAQDNPEDNWGTEKGVYIQRYDSTGNAVGEETLVNSTVKGSQSSASITALSDGGFVVSWESTGQENDPQDAHGFNTGVYLQRFDANGQKVGPEKLVNTYINDSQRASSLISLSDGGFVVTWGSRGQDGSDFGVYLQRYDANGDTVGQEELVNTTTVNNQINPTGTSLPDGGFAIVWASKGQDIVEDASDYGIYMQRYDSNGDKVGEETLVNNVLEGSQDNPFITSLSNGDLVAAWNLSWTPGAEELNVSLKFIEEAPPSGKLVLKDWSLSDLHQTSFQLADGSIIPIKFSGNDLDNNLTGSSVNDEILGNGGNDTLDGGLANDLLTGGSGNDTFIFKENLGHDTITDFVAGAGSEDSIRIEGLNISTFDAVLQLAEQVGDDTVINIDDDNSITLKDVQKMALHADDFQFV